MNDALPIDVLKPDFKQALAAGHVVVSAETGSGKSTRLPLWCAESGRVLVVEPRRVACTALATYLAECRDEAPGQGIGYAIRFDSRFSPDSEVVFVTPGIALRWLAEDGLGGFSLVLIDEFHERRWDTDLLLALLRAQGRHRLVATSATLSGSRLANYLGASALEAEGRSYPVTVSHLARQGRDMPDRRDLPARVSAAVEQAWSETEGDVLVFLPGRGEIQSVQSSLEKRGLECLALHAGIGAAAQQEALRPGRHRRVILATNVAETSLTIPSVTAVVDSGLERRTARRNQRTVLQLGPIAEANAEQRRGRAGRVSPGHCYRLWGRQAPLERFRPPESQREDLTEMMLAAASVGTRLEELVFPEPLPEKSLLQARERLQAMGAVDVQGTISEHGRALFSLPIETLHAHLISAMPDPACQAAMVDLVAGLSVARSLMRLPDNAQARAELAAWQSVACDATTLLAIVRDQAPDSMTVPAGARKEARRLAVQIRQRLGLSTRLPNRVDVDRQQWLRAMAQAAPELLYVRRERRPSAMGNARDEVVIDERSRMEADAQAALVLDDHSVPGKPGTRDTRTIATCLAPLPLSCVRDLGLGEVQAEAVTLEEGEPRVRQVRRYAGRLVEREVIRPSGAALRQAVARLIMEDRLLSPAGPRLQADLRQWVLYVALGKHRESLDPEMPTAPQVPEAEAWLMERLAALGLESPEELPLIDESDLVFSGIPEWEREVFDRQYPAEVFLGDLRLGVEYDIDRKVINLQPVSGQRKHPPQRWELPSWPGWQVFFCRGSKVEVVR